MKPILIRINDQEVSDSIVKNFKKIMKKRGGTDSIATIDVNQNTLDNDFHILNDLIIMNDHLILKNINAYDLFRNDQPFYYDHNFKEQLILCTVIDSYVESIFPKGFKTINVNSRVGLVDDKTRHLLIYDYALIAYLSLSILLINNKEYSFSWEERYHIERILNDKISKVDRNIHSLISRHRKRNRVYQSAI